MDNTNNQNLNNTNNTQSSHEPVQVVGVVPKPEEKKQGAVALWLIPIALLICGGIFKALSLIIVMINDAGGEVSGIAVKIMDILPFVAWGLIVPALIINIIITMKNKKK